MADDERADDLLDEREFPVPCELVFEAWTRAEHFARWFGPHGVTITHCELDARVGGTLLYRQHTPTGEHVWIRGVFDEVVPPSRLAFTFTFVDENGEPSAPPQFQEWPIGAYLTMSVELQATARGTRMIVRHRPTDPASGALPAMRLHQRLARLGWQQTVERFVDFLEHRSS